MTENRVGSTERYTLELKALVGLYVMDDEGAEPKFSNVVYLVSLA